MGLTSALNTSLNGLTLNETVLDVLGNNIANAGTTGFKASRVLFSTQLARTLSAGSRPTGDNGGTNPRQIGLGAQTAAITPDFSQGSITQTTSASDLAVQGDGFFIVDSTDGQLYSRNGNFRLDASDKLSNSQGQRLLGYGIDKDFNLVTTQLTEIEIPLGNKSIAQQTRAINVGGALSPQGTVGTRGTVQTSAAMEDTTILPAGGPAVGSSRLVDLVDAATGTPLFAANSVISFSPIKGGRTLESKTLTVDGSAPPNGTTLDDYMAFLDETLGLQSGGGVPVDAGGPVGVTVNGTGQIVIRGNRGTVNDFDLPVGSTTVNGNVLPLAFTPDVLRANGESTTTAFTLFDSLGTSLVVRMSAVMETQVANKTTYRYFIETPSQSGGDIVVGNGTIEFDNVGRVSASPSNQFSIDRSGTSAVHPMIFTADFSKVSGITSAGSALNLLEQDGTSPGTLTSYVIDEQGVVNGAFDNGVIRNLGQVVLARFTNPTGLIHNGFDNWREGISSGLPQVSTPGTFGTGSLRSGSLEQSNTDIGRNLVDLIVASTNYRGNARVISSVDQLVNELLVLGRG